MFTYDVSFSEGKKKSSLDFFLALLFGFAITCFVTLILQESEIRWASRWATCLQILNVI